MSEFCLKEEGPNTVIKKDQYKTHRLLSKYRNFVLNDKVFTMGT